MSCELDAGPGRLDALIQHLRDEADFNVSWTDGRRGADKPSNEAYISRRLSVAAERESWASMLEAMTRGGTPGPYKMDIFKCTNGELNAGVMSERTGSAVCWATGRDESEEYANARLIAESLNRLTAMKGRHE